MRLVGHPPSSAYQGSSPQRERDRQYQEDHRSDSHPRRRVGFAMSLLDCDRRPSPADPWAAQESPAALPYDHLESRPMRKIAPILLSVALLGTGCFDDDISSQIPRFSYNPGDCPTATVTLIEDGGYDLADVAIDDIRDQVRADYEPNEVEVITDTIMECMDEA